jgi:hypothetical protein
LIAVDRLYGTVSFEDFSLENDGKEEPPLVLKLYFWWMRFMPHIFRLADVARSESEHENLDTAAVAAAGNSSLHAIIVFPVSARRPQGLAPPPLSSPIIIVASSPEPFFATEISAAGTLHDCILLCPFRYMCLFTPAHLPPAPSSLGSWHTLTDREPRATSSSALTVSWPQSVVDALLASEAAGS